MSFQENAKKSFDKISEELYNEILATEEISLSFQAEDQTYLRFNNSKVRQATQVHQQDLALTLQSNGKKISIVSQIGTDHENNVDKILDVLERARAEIGVLPDDPHLVPMSAGEKTKTEYKGQTPSTAEIIETIATHTQGTDFTGFYASGPVIRAASNSLGQNHWFSTDSAFMDYSLYTVNSENENKAIKSCYSERNWVQKDFLADLDSSKQKLAKMKQASKKLNPGEYKVFLSNACFDELLSLFNWGSFSLKAHHDGRCSFSKLYEKKGSLSPQFTLKENFALGLSPQFNTNGELAPTSTTLVENGQFKNFLVNSRSEKEFNIKNNGANEYEQTRSPEVATGTLNEHEAIKKLGTGVWLGNLHYCNWSDMNNARFTGMTRFGCFWVEGGEIVSPIHDLRFDESFYRIFGSNLIDLTSTSKISPLISTYGRREVGGGRFPGALVDNFRFTL